MRLPHMEMEDTRQTIKSHVEKNPGIHFNELVRMLDLASGQVQYHVYRLLNTGKLVEERLYGRTHYYPPGYDTWDRRTLALLRQETARDILISLLAAPGARPGDVADRIDVARSTLEYHVGHLIEQDLVEKQRDERGRVTLHPTRPEATAQLLEEVTPSLPDTFVDRFMRLIDHLLEGS